MKRNKKPHIGHPGKTLKRLMGYLVGKHKALSVLVLLCILVSAAANVAGTLFIKILVDDYITPLLSDPNPVFTGLLTAILMMACLYVVGIAATYCYNRIMAVVAQDVLKIIRDDMFAKMENLPIRYFDTRTHGDIMSCYTNDTDTLMQLITQSIPQFVASAVTILAVFISMIITNLYLTLVVLVFLGVMLFLVKIIGGRSAKYFIRQQQSIAKVDSYIEEMINGQKVIKVFNHEEAAKRDFNGINEELNEAAYQANKYANVLMPVMANVGYFQYVLIAVVGGILALNGISAITIGAIIAFLQLSRSFSQQVGQVSQQLNYIVMAMAGAERIFALMDEPPEVDDGYVTLVNAKVGENGEISECAERTGVWAWKHPHSDGTLTYTRLTGDVRMFDVDFGYVPEKTVLHDVSLYAEPGQKIAFVGATGAGKTTITNLINRFYDIADGKIRYDGININKMKKSDLRRSLGVVLQDVNLFTGTVRENIRFGRLDATDAEIEAAAKLAGADDFIRRLPDGYETMLTGNGANLSQGQRQLISIARAAVADPPVMILDEATSSIDTRTEAIVQRGMDSLMKGRTVFVIAHRLSTVRNSDAIMVLDHGRVIERGSHDSLIAKKGRYYQLYTGAFELE